LNNLFEYSVYTGKSQEFVDISHLLEQAIEDSGIQSGLLVVFCPHTTVGITINENADPDVVVDLIRGLEKVFPKNADYRHYEGNSHAHLKASCMGSSCNIIIADGKPILGTWQGIYLCEFDAPRVRKVYISRIQNKSDA
jgi:secondary thiamine-phosphate synthase enzyme